MTGWDLVATAQQRIGDFWSLTQSQVYRELTAMAQAGLIEAGERGPQERRPYQITDAGRAAFAAWLGQDVAEETTRFPLLLIVMFGRHVPRERLAEVVAQHRLIHTDRLAAHKDDLAARLAGQACSRVTGRPVGVWSSVKWVRSARGGASRRWSNTTRVPRSRSRWVRR